MDLSKLYQTQISLTEWFQRMGLKNAEAHRKEDNEKRERLAILNDLFGLPFNRSVQFPAMEIVDRSERFLRFIDERGDELCALRLIPLDPSLPKLRTRGASIQDSLRWFVEQNIDPARYEADFLPHPTDDIWSTIFVVNQHGAFGQIVAGGHNQLTQGFYDDGTEPITFWWDGISIETNPKNIDAEVHLSEIFSLLRVSDPAVREKLIVDLDAKFFGDYLCGYFETASSKQFGTWFIDWNRILGDAYANERCPILSVGEGSQASLPTIPNPMLAEILPSVRIDDAEGNRITLRGQVGSPGTASGTARVILAADCAGRDIAPGEILVTDMTTPDFLPLMQKAGGVITQHGGILSHAAIVCRELGKPCVTNVKNLLATVHDGDSVDLNADMGTITVS